MSVKHQLTEAIREIARSLHVLPEQLTNGRGTIDEVLGYFESGQVTIPHDVRPSGLSPFPDFVRPRLLRVGHTLLSVRTVTRRNHPLLWSVREAFVTFAVEDDDSAEVPGWRELTPDTPPESDGNVAFTSALPAWKNLVDFATLVTSPRPERSQSQGTSVVREWLAELRETRESKTPSIERMDVREFVAKWRDEAPNERTAIHEHFIDLCRVLGVPTPVEADPPGIFYTFPDSASPPYVDVWYHGKFAWEYKRRNADLKAAYLQLLKYQGALGNPPLLVVSDIEHIEIHTNFADTGPTVHAFGLDDLARPEVLRILRLVFTNPEALRPIRAEPFALPSQEEWTVGQVAQHFGVKPATLYRWIQTGIVPKPTATWHGRRQIYSFSRQWVTGAEAALHEREPGKHR